jgi:hypothetical protein
MSFTAVSVAAIMAPQASILCPQLADSSSESLRLQQTIGSAPAGQSPGWPWLPPRPHPTVCDSGAVLANPLSSSPDSQACSQGEPDT